MLIEEINKTTNNISQKSSFKHFSQIIFSMVSFLVPKALKTISIRFRLIFFVLLLKCKAIKNNL